jgi:hypothetical protein
MASAGEDPIVDGPGYRRLPSCRTQPVRCNDCFSANFAGNQPADDPIREELVSEPALDDGLRPTRWAMPARTSGSRSQPIPTNQDLAKSARSRAASVGAFRNDRHHLEASKC